MRREGTIVGCLLLSLVVSSVAVAQKPKIRKRALPSWVEAEVGDPAAVPKGSACGGAEYLFHELAVRPQGGGRVAFRSRRVVRVLDDRGLSFAVNRLDIDDFDTVEIQDSWRVQADGTVTGPDVRKRPSEVPYLQDDMVTDTRIRTVQLPGVRVGDLVVHEAAWVSSFDLGGVGFTFGNAKVEVKKARLVVEAPEGWTLGAQHRRKKQLSIIEGGSRLAVEAADLEPPVRRDFDPPLQRLLPTTWVHWASPDGKQGFSDWNAVGRWYHQLASGPRRDRGAAVELGRQMKPADDDGLLEAIRQVYQHAAREVRYAAIELGIGGWKPTSPRQTCEQRHGDCKAKAALVCAMTEEWPDLKSYMVLVRTSGIGDLPTETPTAGAFNHAIVALALPEGIGPELWATAEVEGLGRLLFLDPTVRYGDAFDLRSDVQGTTALVTHAGGGVLVDLPVRPAAAATVTSVLHARVDQRARLVNGTLEETWSGGRATVLRRQLSGLDDAQRRQLVATDLADNIPLAQVSDYQVVGLSDATQPVTEMVSFTGGKLGQSAGGLLIVELGGSVRPAIRGSFTRETIDHELRLGLPSTYTCSVGIEVPEGFVPEELPEPLDIDDRYLRVRARWSFKDGKLRYARTCKVLENRVAAADYAAFKKSVEAVQRLDRGSVVLLPAG
ncbi:MAG: DUF3857 domain-containing protein [Acidobacteriota bacterium]